MADTNTLPRAESEPRARKLTFEEFVAAAEAGVFGDEARVELIEGEIIDLAPQSDPHSSFKNALAEFFFDHRGPDLRILVEPTVKLAPSTGVDPDLVVLRRDASLSPIDPSQCLLVVEVAVSSVDHDLRRKAHLYAAAGVTEYWVVDVRSAVTHVHDTKTPDGAWAPPRLTPFSQHLVPRAAPQLSIQLADL